MIPVDLGHQASTMEKLDSAPVEVSIAKLTVIFKSELCHLSAASSHTGLQL